MKSVLALGLSLLLPVAAIAGNIPKDIFDALLSQKFSEMDDFFVPNSYSTTLGTDSYTQYSLKKGECHLTVSVMDDVIQAVSIKRLAHPNGCNLLASELPTNRNFSVIK